MNKRELSERDICTKYITPAIERAGWDINSQMREEVYFTDGRIQVQGWKTCRLKGKKADYILYKDEVQIAVIEAKGNKRSVSSGIQQALEYADILDIPFAFSSNGDGFLFHDRISGQETELKMDEFPSPEKLWSIYKQHKNIDAEREKIILWPYHRGSALKEPRYYQRIAINRAIEAISQGQDRILLVMATGTGKTYTAFQIIWKLWKAKKKKRILFLADRNILADQARNNDFAPFGQAMTKIQGRKTDKSYEIFLALYQKGLLRLCAFKR